MHTSLEDTGQAAWPSAARRGKETLRADRALTPATEEFEGDAFVGSGETPTTSSGRILVIDDEPAVARLTSLVLEQYGYAVDVAHSGAHALKQLAETPDVRVVVVDLTMPDLSGAQVLRAAREQGFDTPMILTSGYPRSETEGGNMDAGFAGYLQKPYKIESLIAAIREALGEA